MNRKTLRKLELHAQAAADLICDEITVSAPKTLADHARGVDVSKHALDTLAAFVDSTTLYRVAASARTARKEF